MVILSASVCTRSGKTLFARQFVQMSRPHVEGLIAAFPKLLATSKQHTYVDAANVRYVFQPLENLYVVAITNKTSNIVQDLETVRLLARVVRDMCKFVEEDEVANKIFELIFAFDEVVSFGIGENLGLDQIRTLTAMVSNEEMIAEALKKSREKKADEEKKRQIKRIEDQKKELARIGRSNLPGGMGSEGLGSSGGYTPGALSEDSTPRYQKPEPKVEKKAMPMKKGMALSKKIHKEDVASAMMAEAPESPHAVAESTRSPAMPGPTPTAKEEAVHLLLSEKVNAVLRKEGGMDRMEVKGEMALKLASADVATIKVAVNQSEASLAFVFKTHPKVDKDMWVADSVIGLKDPKAEFPYSGNPLGVVKWRLETTDEDQLPLSVTCWPSVDTSSTEVTVEYEVVQAGMEFRNVVILIPLPPNVSVKVEECEGQYEYNARNNNLKWTVPAVTKDNKRGTLVFVVNSSADEDVYFPVNISYSSPSVLCGLSIAGVTHALTGEAVRFTTESVLSTEECTVV